MLRSLNDIEQQIDELKREPAAVAVSSDSSLLSRIEVLESRLNGLSQFERVSQPFADYKNDGNPSRVLHEDGTWMEPLAGIAKAIPSGLDSDRARPTNLLNVLGSLAITGALSADTVRCRVLKNRFIGVQAYNNANITVNTGTGTLITLNSENYDTDAFHSTSSNTSRLTVPTGYDGYYRVTGRVRFAATATLTWRTLRLEVNSAGTATAANIFANSTDHTSNNQIMDMECSGTIYLIAGDYIEMFAQTGENTTATYTDLYYDSPSLEMFRIGGL